MCVREQANHLAESGFGAEFIRTDLEPAKLIDRTGEDRVPLSLVDRHAFAGEHGLIDGGAAARHGTVGADTLARANDDDIADCQLLDRDLDLRKIALHAGCLRVDREERADRALARANVNASRHSPSKAMKTTSAATKYSPRQAAATQATARAISAPIEPSRSAASAR